MAKYLLSFLLSIIIFTSAKPQVVYDTVETTNVGPGVVYRRIIAPAIPWSINELEIDLKNPFGIFETVKGGDKFNTLETVRSMAERNNYSGHTVVGAINGDFYSNGNPVNIQISKGEIVRGPVNRPAFGLDVNNLPMIDAVNYSGEVVDRDSSIQLNGVNASRGTDQMILFNHFYGSSTGTNAFGTEVSIRAIDTWLVNDTVKCVVVDKAIGAGNMKITDTTAVLSGHGLSKTYLDNNVAIGDTILVINKISPGLAKLKEMVGGYPDLVLNGNNIGNTASREPRTAVGFNEDSTKLFLFIVDGRQPGFSVGVNFHELADLMIKAGVYTGLNLDGGGSSTMLLRDSVVNSPSDGNERPVSNSLLVITSAPQNGALNSVQISPDYFKLFKGEQLQFKLQGFDSYFNPAGIDPADVSYSVDPGLGTITPSGFLSTSGNVDTGYVYAEYNGLKDSALIVMKSLSNITIVPNSVVTDTFRVQKFDIEAFDTEGIQKKLPLTEYTWSVSNPAVGVIDSAGNFRGLSDGTTKVIVSFKGISDTAEVKVETNTGVHLIDPMDDFANWTYTTENLDPSGSNVTISTDEFTQGTGSFAVNYQITMAPSTLYWFYLDTDIPITGVPDSIYIDEKTDGQRHVIYFLVEDDNGEQFKIPIKKYLTNTDKFDTVGAKCADATPINPYSNFNFPITLKQIQIKLAATQPAGETYKGTIYLDNLRVSYPGNLTAVEGENRLPSDYSLSQNYPNPFNPSTVISYHLPQRGAVSLKIYDMLGREVETLANGIKEAGSYIVTFNAGNLSSGVYLYRLTVKPVDGNSAYTAVKKLMLLK